MSATASPLAALWGRFSGGQLELSPALSLGAHHEDGAQCAIIGRLQRLDRLHGAHRLPAGPPAGLLLALSRASGPARALSQLEGSFNALIVDGQRLSLARDRLGQLGWWWRPCVGGVEFAAHPAALSGQPGAPLRPLGPGGLLQVAAGQPAVEGAWWTAPEPPEGRGGARAGWDRAAGHAWSLAALRAREASGGSDGAGPTAEPGAALALVARAALPVPLDPGAAPAVAQLAALLGVSAETTSATSVWARPPAQSSEAQGAWSWPAGPCALLPTAPGALLGEGLPLRGGGPAWSAALAQQVERVFLPLSYAAVAAGGAVPALPMADPGLISVLGQIPALHLRGLRRSLGARLGLRVGGAP